MLPSQISQKIHISIHASRGGSDLSRTSLYAAPYISIHASRGGSDHPGQRGPLSSFYFNPRFPRGKRQWQNNIRSYHCRFQSTLPAGEATILKLCQHCTDRISIHASRGGSDSSADSSAEEPSEFQSTLPAGEATLQPVFYLFGFEFQSTLPAGEATGEGG